MQVLKANLSTNQSKKIALNSVSSITFVELDNILFFQADGAYTKVFLKDNKTITTSKNLKHFEQLLEDSPEFFRCHKSYIANLKYVSEYIKSEGGTLKIENYSIGISSDKSDELLKRIMH